MNGERLTWWVVFGAFALILMLSLLGIYISFVAFTLPEGVAFLLGFMIFLLLGNRLVFGYSNLILTLDAVASGGEIDRRKLLNKLKEPVQITENLSDLSLIALWVRDLDYYRYAYYGIFALLLLLAVLTKLNLFGSLSVGNYVEGSLWGAAVVTFVVWSLELMSRYLLFEVLGKNR